MVYNRIWEVFYISKDKIPRYYINELNTKRGLLCSDFPSFLVFGEIRRKWSIYGLRKKNYNIFRELITSFLTKISNISKCFCFYFRCLTYNTRHFGISNIFISYNLLHISDINIVTLKICY